MAESKSKVNFLQDIALPVFAFLSSAYSPQGAVAAQALTGALQVGQRRRAGQREDARLDQLMGLRQQEAQARSQALQQRAEQQRQEFEAGAPQRDLQAAQSGFELENLQGIQDIIGAPAPTTGAVQALGVPQVARLQEALGRGEQAPLPMEAPTPQMRQQRFQDLATTPSGTAQLTAAGLGDVAQRTQALLPKPEDPRQFAADKREAMKLFQGLPEGQIDPKLAKQLKQGVSGAKTQQELTDAIAQVPIGMGAPKGSIEEDVYRELTGQGMSGIEALKNMAAAKREPESAGERQERQARIAKINSDIQKNKREATGELSKSDRIKLQSDTRKQITGEPVYKDYQSALGGYTAVSVGAKRGDAQGDLAILNGIVRLLDPGSVVRPSEFETARSAQGLIEQLEVLIPRVKEGEILNPNTRQRYLSLANDLLREYSNTATQEVGQVYGSLLDDTGVSLQNVFVQPRPIAIPESSGDVATLAAPPEGPPQAQQAPASPSAPAQPSANPEESGMMEQLSGTLKSILGIGDTTPAQAQPQAPQPAQGEPPQGQEAPAFTIKGIREKQ